MPKKLSIKSLGWLTLLNIISSAVGVALTIVTAMIFGVSRTIEVFFAATTFVLFLQQVISTGQLGDVFTPIFHDLKVSSGRQIAWDAFSAMTNAMLLPAIVLALIGTFFADQFAQILVPGFSNEDVRLCGRVFFFTAPVLVPQVLSSMYGNLLRAEHYYGVEEIFGLLSRVLNLAVVALFGWKIGIWALVIGLWLSAVVGLIGQVAFSFRMGFRHRMIFSTAEFRPSYVLHKVPYTLAHTFAAQFFAFALTSSFSYLPAGPYATYNYAKRLLDKFQGVVLRPIGLVFFNQFSQSLAEGAPRVRSLADHALSLSVAVVTLTAVPIIAAGDLLLMGIWGGDSFPIQSIREAHWILAALTLMLVINSQYLVSRRTNLALKVVARQFVASGAVMLVTGLLCFWLIPKYGVYGAVALQYIAALGTCVTTIFVLRSVDRDLVAIISAQKFLCWLISCCVAVVAIFALRDWFGPDLEASRWSVLTAATLYGVLSVALCAAVSWLLRIEESIDFVSKMSSRILCSRSPSSQASR